MLLFTLLPLLISGHKKPCSPKTNPRFHNGHFYPDTPISFRQLEGVPLEFQTATFDFGAEGWAQQYFYFNTTAQDEQLPSIYVWDCYCAGDSFNVYVDGEFLGSTEFIGLFPPSQFFSQCFYYSAFSVDCWSNNVWSQLELFQLPLKPGYHEVLLQVKTAYYNGGAGFITRGSPFSKKKND